MADERDGRDGAVTGQHSRGSRPAGGRRRWLFRLLAATAVPLLFFVLLELGLRLAGKGRDPHFFVARDFDGRAVVTENERFGWRFFPSAIARRPSPVVLPPAKDEGEFRVFLLGSSAAMGDPEPSYGMARLLEEMLRASCPDRKVRVVNAAMTSINSHVLTEIAKDCAAMEPDLFIVYEGNNEAIGPWGPGTVFARAQSLPMVRAAKWLQTTRIGQMAQSMRESAGKDAAEQEQWGGIRMFMEHQLAADDPAVERMYSHFAANLEQIADIAESAGAATIMCTVAVNLRNCSPFASLHGTGISTADRERFAQTMDDGLKALRAGDAATAASHFDGALAIDDRFAAAHFMAGRAREALGEAAKAAEHYELARDLDALRFRTDSAMNEAIRRAFGQREGVRLVDVEALIAERSAGVPGFDWFVDHVHFTFDGNAEVARALCAEVLDAMQCGPQATIANDELRERMAYSEFDELQIARTMAGRYAKPPYTNQIDHEADLAHWASAIERGSAALDPGFLTERLAWHERRIAAHPDDWASHSLHARYVSALGRADDEAKSWGRVLELIPHDTETHAVLAQALARAGQHQEAIRHAHAALKANAADPTAYNALGMAHAGLKDPERARQHYAKALALRPGYDVVLHNLAVLELEQGTAATQGESLRAILEAEPANAEMRVAYARVLLSELKVDEAIEQYRLALPVAPNPAAIHWELGRIAYERADPQMAREQLELAIKADPGMADAFDLLGLVMAESQELAAAERLFRESLRLRPDHAQTLFQLGIVVDVQGRAEEAEKIFDAAIAADATHAEAHQWSAAALERRGKHDEALARYRKALALRPDWPEVQNGIAWILAVHPDAESRNPQQAVELARKACEATQYAVPSFVDTLATAHAAAGEFDKAVETARNAQQLAARSEGGGALAADIQTRLDLFERNEPFVLDP